MKYIFVDGFDIVWNGYTARYENGISGSNGAIMYLAEAIAKDKNNTVEIVSTANNTIENTYLNVKYTNFINFEYQSCNYIITVNVLNTLSILDKIENYNKIIILTQNDLYSYEKLFNIDKNKILIGYISEFAKTNILNVQPFLKEYSNILLYNSIDLNDLNNISIVEHKIKKNQLCFFACYDRGYKMVIEIIDKLNNYQLVFNNYYNISIQNHKVIITENSAKNTIFKYISESKYFVYPLINLDNNCIHYDTFGYVVLEALSLGCIVIAPRIKVFEELYGDAICYIDTDDIIPIDDLLYWKKQNSNFGYPILDRYIEKIKLLDDNEELCNSYINKGLLLKEKFCNIKIASILTNYLSDNFENIS